MIPSGFRFERLRVDREGELISKEFQDYLSSDRGVARVRQHQHAAANRHIRTRCKNSCSYGAVYACRQWTAKASVGRIDFTAAFLGNKASHSAIGMQSPYKMLHGTEPDLRLFRVIGARTFVHIETYSKNFELKAVEGRLVGCSNNGKSYRVYNPATRRIMKSRNVIFFEIPSRLFPPPLEENSQQVNTPSNGMDAHN